MGEKTQVSGSATDTHIKVGFISVTKITVCSSSLCQ